MIPFCSSVSYSISVLQLLYLGAQCVSVCSQLLRKSKKKNALKLLDQKQLKIFFTTFLLHYYENFIFDSYNSNWVFFHIGFLYFHPHMYLCFCLFFHMFFFPSSIQFVFAQQYMVVNTYMQYCIVVLTSLSLSDSNANKGRVTSMSCQSYLIHPVKNGVGQRQ